MLFHNIWYLDAAWRGAGKKVMDLIDTIGVRPSTYGRWKKGRTLPDNYNTKALADLIGITSEELKTVPLENLERSVSFLRKLQVMKLVENASALEINFLYEYLRDGYLTEEIS